MAWTYIDDVQVDATISENTSLSNEISSYPLEDGTVAQDHINNNPIELSLDVTITGEYGGTAQEKYERLLELRNEREVFSVTGALQVYDNMAISELSLEKTSENVKGYSGSVSLQQIRFATAETITVEIAPPVINDEEQPAPEGEGGETSTKDSQSENVDEETANNKSLLQKLGDLL